MTVPTSVSVCQTASPLSLLSYGTEYVVFFQPWPGFGWKCIHR